MKLKPELLQNFLAFLDVGAFHANDYRHFEFQFFRGIYYAAGEDVATKDAAENIHEDGFDVGIAEQNAKSVLYLFFRSATAYVEKIRGAAAAELDDVHGGHGEAGAIDHAATCHRA